MRHLSDQMHLIDWFIKEFSFILIYLIILLSVNVLETLLARQGIYLSTIPGVEFDLIEASTWLWELQIVSIIIQVFH